MVLWRGRLTTGLGEAGGFLSLPWVQEQFESKLGFTVYPGTLNLDVNDWQSLVEWLGTRTPIVIEPPAGSNFCLGLLYPVSIVPGAHRGAIFRPDLEDYPVDKIEIVAEHDLRQWFTLTQGSWLQFQTLPEVIDREA